MTWAPPVIVHPPDFMADSKGWDEFRHELGRKMKEKFGAHGMREMMHENAQECIARRTRVDHNRKEVDAFFERLRMDRMKVFDDH